ncbi:MoxR-like ATPase [Filimonas lacunae]|uniref:MoxR-like ATPase n=1 Tax=Filimonas lacunae TaxID=477680 RepID=A0A173MF70_9BACT|nr:MoxR family ATPase [Filimonas lacunae]BAV06078.1 MoxR-like ATPases [Filimonas lacunae]SIT24561.1 MoxR-like ATPase [Filimonas lacunae]
MEDILFEQRLNLSELSAGVQRLQQEIKKVIVGQDEMVQLLITAILSDGHVLIEGVPGVAKTLAAKLVARSIQVGFSRIQFTPDLMPSDVLGTNIFNPGSGRFEFKQGPIFGQVVLIDEVNRAPAKTQSALFEVMEERQVTIDGVTHKMLHPFMVLATQNPIEQEGTYRLPEAQLDRFLFKIKVPYPSEAEEIIILQRFQQMDNEEKVQSVQPVISGDDVLKLRALTRQVIADEKLLSFIAKIVVATRNDKAVYLGASPRASLALLNAARATAAILGRDFITPEDIVYVSKPVLRHRLVLTPEKEMEGVTEDEVIQRIVHSIEIPR